MCYSLGNGAQEGSKVNEDNSATGGVNMGAISSMFVCVCVC